MEGRKNFKQKENTRSYKVPSIIKEVYSRVWFLGRERGFGECKRGSSRVWRENEYRSKTTEKVEYSKEKKL